MKAIPMKSAKKNGVVQQLHEALEVEEANEKNYYVRQALQLICINKIDI